MRSPYLFIVLALFVIIGVVVFGSAMKATDYEAGNETGVNNPYTDQSMTTYEINYAWWGGLAFLMIIFALWTVFRIFTK